MAILATSPHLGRSYLATEKFYIYSSKATKVGKGIDLVPGSSTDTFVISLDDHLIVLQSEPPKPDLVGEFDQTDKSLIWLSNLETGGKKRPFPKLSVQLAKVGQEQPENFVISLTTPFPVQFNSTADALIFSFGKGTGGGARIPVPGIDPAGQILYCGLDTSQTKPTNCTVKEILRYAGLLTIADAIPNQIASLQLKLDIATASGKRNAFWFNSKSNLGATVRLQLQLGESKVIQDLIQTIFHNVTIGEVDFICKKRILERKSASGAPYVAVEGTGAFRLACSIDSNNITAYIQFGYSRATFILLPGPKLLGAMVQWLGKLVGATIDVEGPLKSSTGFDIDRLNLRRISIDLALVDTKFTSIDGFEIDIEVPATFGHDDKSNKPVVFLLTYSWQKETSWVLRGKFWSDFGPLKDRDLSPQYEEWLNMVPLTPDPAEKLNILKIVPGGGAAIEDMPSYIPDTISAASIEITNSSITISGTVESSGGTDTIPHPPLTRLALMFKYQWGKSPGFQLSFSILMTLPVGSSSQVKPATLLGQLVYQHTKKLA